MDFSRVQIPPPKSQKYLFHVPLTNNTLNLKRAKKSFVAFLLPPQNHLQRHVPFLIDCAGYPRDRDPAGKFPIPTLSELW